MHRDKRSWRGGDDDDGELMACVRYVELVYVGTSEGLGGTYETSWPGVSDPCLGGYHERVVFRMRAGFTYLMKLHLPHPHSSLHLSVS